MAITGGVPIARHLPAAAATRPISGMAADGWGASSMPAPQPAATRTSLMARFSARLAYGWPYWSPKAVR